MEKLLTIQQLSEYLQVSPKTIYNWTHTKYIPHIKLAKSIRFKKDRIEKWLKAKEKKGSISFGYDIKYT